MRGSGEHATLKQVALSRPNHDHDGAPEFSQATFPAGCSPTAESLRLRKVELSRSTVCAVAEIALNGNKKVPDEHDARDAAPQRRSENAAPPPTMQQERRNMFVQRILTQCLCAREMYIEQC